MARILLVDDDTSFTSATKALLQQDSHDVMTAGTFVDASKALDERAFDILLVDIALPDGSGLELIKDNGPKTVVITGHPSVETAIRAVRGPVLDYLVKPLDRRQLNKAIDLAFPSGHRVPHSADLAETTTLVGSSPVMAALRKEIAEYGPTDATVLISGESGTGKELVALALHESRDPDSEFVTVNCGAIPRELIASELFGHEKGAFTGAAGRRPGVFERAGSGTVFLDEIGELPLDQQVALLRVLESRSVTRVGGNKTIPIEARVIAATNKDLEQSVRDGEFREDLYFRLMVLPIQVPALRNRRGDVALLTEFFLAQFAEEYDTPLVVAPEVLDLLDTYQWPGNVRELKHTLLRAAILNRRKNAIESLPQNFDRPPLLDGESGGLRPGMAIRDVEKALIEKTLQHFRGNRKETAAALGISLKTLYNRLREYESDSAEEAQR